MRCGAAVSWGARSQGKVAHSSSDSELRALAEVYASDDADEKFVSKINDFD